MKRKSIMAFPHRPPSERQSELQNERLTDSCNPLPHDRPAADRSPLTSRSAAAPLQGSAAVWPTSAMPRCHLQSGAQIEGEHQLEKLEFALAVALTRGDHGRSRLLRDQIEALGGNREEPGT